MVKLVLFDIDGTLVRTGRAGIKAFAKAFSHEFGLHDGSERMKFAGRTDVSLVREFFRLHQVDPTPEHFSRFFDVYTGFLQQTIVESEGEVIPGVSRFMAELRALPEPPAIGLLTGNIRRGAQIKLSHYKLWSEFAFGGFADDHEDRDCIAAVAKKRGVEAIGHPLQDDEVVVIGDTPLDVRCARAIRAKVIAVATGGHPLEELKQANADWAVADLTSLTAKAVCE